MIEQNQGEINQLRSSMNEVLQLFSERMFEKYQILLKFPLAFERGARALQKKDIPLRCVRTKN